MKTLRIFSGLIICFCILITSVYGKDVISSGGRPVGEKEEYQGIISLWQIDSFEGGRGSRKQFLMKVARSFEKQNKGVLVVVSDYTAEGAEKNFEKGIYPDLISFGLGTEISGTFEISEEQDFIGGKVGQKLYATPWCRGGYVLIFNPLLIEGDEQINSMSFESLLVSQGENTNPLLALINDDIKVNTLEIKSPMDAYVKFVSGKVKVMLGTQRDVVRLETRGMEVLTRSIKGYNDLYQYISLTSSDSIKRVYAQRFIKHLMMQETQKTLNEISMMSAFYKVEFDNQHLEEMQKEKNFTTIPCFTLKEQLKEIKLYANNFYNGDISALNKIKNMLVYP